MDPFTLEGVSTSRCIILPLMGLLWSSKPQLAYDVPTWDTLGSPPQQPTTAIHSSSFRRHNNSSQTSEMVEAEPASDLPCYLFEHESNGGSEVAVIFPETDSLNRILELCQRHGGACKENNPPFAGDSTADSALSTSYSVKLSGHHINVGLRRNRKSLPDSAVRRKFAADAAYGIRRIRDGSLGLNT